MMKAGTSVDPIIKVNPPAKKDIIIVRVLILSALLSMIMFIGWFADPEHIGYGPIFWLLTFGLLFKLVKMLHEWYHYWSPSIPERPRSSREWKVDMLTTSCPGEPKEMIIRTLRAMVAVKYPHTTYLCDEGDDPELKNICRELGVVHVTRTLKIDAKAGNINNALKQASGEICVVLDPDHVPVPEFLDRVLPYFEDPEIGFVQCVQAYSNQSESIIALGAAEQTYHFYGPMMMTMNTYGTVQAIGANCTFRRSALDSIGGHAAGLSEDMHTAMQLHARGWKSVYVPEILTRGLVPATLSSYYKQQLKWSRGTFELLFRTFPKLSQNFTWRQKIHYFTIPLYFLFGLINLIDIAIPVAALSLAEVPWSVNLGNFALYFLPLCGFSLLIRLFAQRWLLERHEHGLHIAGGLLRTATWWIFLVGFIYTIFRIKVPYIPTPKEDAHNNYWRLSVPNIVVVVICSAAIFYGLSIDWTPYSIAMAVYGLINAAMLCVIVLMSQQKLVGEIRTATTLLPGINYVNSGLRFAAVRSRRIVYGGIRNGTVALIIGASLLFFSYSTADSTGELSGFRKKELGGFYLGLTDDQFGLREKSSLPRKTKFSVLTVEHNWAEDSARLVNDLAQVRRFSALPYLTWKPVNAIGNDSLYHNIKNGVYDRYLTTCAGVFRSYGHPVFISFAPGFDDPVNPYAGKDRKAFIAAWQHIYTFFNNLGISNLTWVWSPSLPASADFYPGTEFVDWIGVSCLNYGTHPRDDDWYSFSDLYKNYRKAFGKFRKPVMITELGCQAGLQQEDWLTQALGSIADDYKEIRSVVFYKAEKHIPVLSTSDTTVYVADFSFAFREHLISRLQKEPFNRKPVLRNIEKPSTTLKYTSPFIKGTPGHFTLMINNAPYYIRGVAYNTAHDWRDGNMPLTRKQVEKDLQMLVDMGANTIRRYDHGVYDRNILNISGEYKMNVLFGFWFDPDVDYYRDTNRVQEYIEEVTEKVLQYKDHRSVIAWSLGNETWGLLKHRYSKPYLSLVRDAYIQMIERLARTIHEIDPSRPVFSSIEHEEYQLPGELAAFRDKAPSIDVIGINSYYREQISMLNHVTYEFDSLRPYLISEFGPRGYWDPSYNKTREGSLIEEKESVKAAWYKEQWSQYVQPFKGYNIGGFAYCWHDRMEGSYTWFGLTDYKGRPKPSYYALKELWTRKKQELLPDYSISAPAVMEPGKEYKFRVLANGNNPAVEYEWYLLKDEFLERVDNIEETEVSGEVLITIPEKKSGYRLYLYAKDSKGNVSTASLPVKVS